MKRHMILSTLTLGLCLVAGISLAVPPAKAPAKTPAKASATAPSDGSVLPFPSAPSASVAGRTLQESTMKRRVEPNHLPKDAPNVLIVLIDDVGFGTADTFGGPIHTPTLSRLADEGIRYNSFHTTSICSPTRAALLTGRNHQRVGSGTIAERAVDWDGYTGVMPKTAATVAEVLRNYGYKTSAFGKWHNTPADQTTAMGPFTYWPTSYGFDYFYGFLAGETSQWEPRLVENTNVVEPPHDEKYHLTEDMAEKALTWLKRHRAFTPDKPFFMYWAPGGGHGPHHVSAEWADKYKGRFDDGWDAHARAHLQEAEGARLDSRRHQAHATGEEHGRLGQHPRRRAPLPDPPDGGLRRLRRAHRRPGGQARRRPRGDGPPREHDHPLRVGRQRVERRGAEREHQRAARPERHPEHDPAAARGARRARRPRRPSAAR